MKKLINFFIAFALICSMSILNVVSIEAKVELPDPIIGLSDDEINKLATDTSENPGKNTTDSSIEPRIRRNVNSTVNIQKSVSLTPAPFKEQDKDDLHTTLLQRDTLTEELYDTGFDSSDDEFMPGEIIICFKEECSSSIISELMTKQKVIKTQDIYKSVYDSFKQGYSVNAANAKLIKEDIGKYYLVKIASKSKEDVLKTIEELNKESIVKYAEPNYISKPCMIPNDYNNYNLWNMNRIQMPEAWDVFPGNSVKVGVLDTGIDATHPDLRDNIDTDLGWNCAKKANVDTMDYYSHGTHVAGTIGATGNNSIGVVGVNPNAKLVPIKICYANDNAASDASLMAEGIGHATKYGIPVCNLSYGISNCKLLRDAIKKYGESGGIITIAAGNDGKCIDNDPAYSSLAEFDNVILVACSDDEADENEALAEFSNYGKCVNVAAPGTGIISTVPTSINTRGYEEKWGTSMAAPHVAGLVSLLKGRFSNMTSVNIKEAIIDTADFVPKIAGNVASGRINAKNTINTAYDEAYLKVVPNAGETMATAIKRSLGSRQASKITKIKVFGNVVMDSGYSSNNSANAVLPNLKYVDISHFTGDMCRYAFYGCKNLTTVILPENNVKLPAYCFMNCTMLSTIYRANRLARIINEADLTELISSSTGQYAVQTQCFQGCTSLKTIKLPNTSKIRLAQFTFNDCSNLSTAYINTQTPIVGEADLTELTELGCCIFRGTGIASVKLPKNVNISQEAFANCLNLKNIQVYPSQVDVITVHSRAFENVNSQCRVYMNEELYGKSIVFQRTTTENIPKEINTIIAWPLDDEKMSDMINYYLDYYGLNSSAIKHLVIAENVVMGDSDDSESARILPNLETVDISMFKGQLGANAFYNCTKLKTVIRGSDLTYVPAQCFMNCKSLTGIIVENKYPKIWNEADLTNLSGELSIDTQGFEECTSLKTVKFPSAKIGFAGAFAYCTNLSTIYKDGCEKQNGVFDLTGVSKFWSGWGHNFKRTYVDTVKLPKDIDISEYCFYNCSRLGRIEFDNTQISPVTIGACAFYGVNYGCNAFMHLNLVNNPSFQLKRNSTTNIPKRTY